MTPLNKYGSTQGLIFNIQDYAVNDGPGIRTIVFMKGCPLNCLWCANPEGQKPDWELMYSRALCQRCHRCIQACPHGGITQGSDGFLSIDRTKCTTCQEQVCEQVCLHRALKIAGEYWTPEALYQRVKTNSLYYRNSQGGVTLSGGEPLAQPDFVREFLTKCAQTGISVGVETSGMFAWDQVADFIEDFDFYFFDIKFLELSKHRQATGVPNRLILENLQRLAELEPGKIIISLAIIPGFNDNRAFVTAAANFCQHIGVKKIRLLPYHSFGMEKYRDLGREYPLNPKLQIDLRRMEEFAKLIQKKGIESWVE